MKSHTKGQYVGPEGGTVSCGGYGIYFGSGCLEKTTWFAFNKIKGTTKSKAKEPTDGFYSFRATPTLSLSSRPAMNKLNFRKPVTVYLSNIFDDHRPIQNAQPRIFDGTKWKYLDNSDHDCFGEIVFETTQPFHKVEAEVLVNENDKDIFKHLKFYGICDFTSSSNCCELCVCIDTNLDIDFPSNSTSTCFQMIYAVAKEQNFVKVEFSSNDAKFDPPAWTFNIKDSFFKTFSRKHVFKVSSKRPFLPLDAKCNIRAFISKEREHYRKNENFWQEFSIRRPERSIDKCDVISEAISPIGPEGGRVCIGESNFGISVPENTFPENIDITLRLLGDKPHDMKDKDILELTPILQCLPSRLAFAKDVSVTLPVCLSYETRQPLVLTVQTNEGNGWKSLKTTTVTTLGDTITFPINSFSFKRVIITKLKEKIGLTFSKKLSYVCYRNENPTPRAALRWKISDSANVEETEPAGIAFAGIITAKLGKDIVMAISEDEKNVSLASVKASKLHVPGAKVMKSAQFPVHERELWHSSKTLSYSIRYAKTNDIIEDGDFTFPYSKDYSLEQLSRRRPISRKVYRNDMMISYNWADSSELTEKIYENLTNAGYKVWFDKADMFGDKYEAMAEAVDNSNVFLMFVSPNYKTSEDCKKEAEYAASKKKKIIPIRVKEGYEPDGWLALLETGKIYYDFSKLTFVEAFGKLCKEIDRYGKAE